MARVLALITRQYRQMLYAKDMQESRTPQAQMAKALGVPPFDQPEAETEILEGPLLEYSGVLLAFFHMASALKMVVALALGVVLFFPGTISDIPAVNLVWFVVKCALFMLFTLTVVKSATGRLRIEQALSFFLKYPAGLALLSLILVWIGC